MNVKPHLTNMDLKEFKEFPQTHRLVLSICNVIYDPLELAAPYTIKLKLLMREILALGVAAGWDDPVSPKLVRKWGNTMEERISQDELWLWHYNPHQNIHIASNNNI